MQDFSYAGLYFVDVHLICNKEFMCKSLMRQTEYTICRLIKKVMDQFYEIMEDKMCFTIWILGDDNSEHSMKCEDILFETYVFFILALQYYKLKEHTYAIIRIK